MPSPAPTKAPVHPAQPGQIASDGERSEQRGHRPRIVLPLVLGLIIGIAFNLLAIWGSR